MIGIVVPAHNEEAALPDCLEALARAACHEALAGEAVRIAVVLDACDDGSRRVVLDHGARARTSLVALTVDARNVGVARAAGAAWLVEAGARWLAFTDADTHVAPDWLSAQLALDVDAVCGSVGVTGWGLHSPSVRAAYESQYDDADGHRHVHGANLGVSTAAYLLAGGFEPLPCREDVALVDALTRHGARIAWSAKPRVTTSARRVFRARGGFGDYLLSLQAR